MRRGLWHIFKSCVHNTLNDSFEVSKTETLDRTYYGCSRVDYMIRISTLSLKSHSFDILVRFLMRMFSKAVKEK